MFTYFAGLHGCTTLAKKYVIEGRDNDGPGFSFVQQKQIYRHVFFPTKIYELPLFVSKL